MAKSKKSAKPKKTTRGPAPSVVRKVPSERKFRSLCTGKVLWAVVPMDFFRVATSSFDGTIEGLNEYADELLVPEGVGATLEGISYRVIGAGKDGKTILVAVTADASVVLAELDNPGSTDTIPEGESAPETVVRIDPDVDPEPDTNGEARAAAPSGDTNDDDRPVTDDSMFGTGQ